MRSSRVPNVRARLQKKFIKSARCVIYSRGAELNPIKYHETHRKAARAVILLFIQYERNANKLDCIWFERCGYSRKIRVMDVPCINLLETDATDVFNFVI